MSTDGPSKAEHRTYISKGCKYLLNDETMTAWIVRGARIGRKKRYRIPEYIEIDKTKYTIVSIELGAFRPAKCLKHLVVSDSVEYIDEYNFSSLPSLRSIYIGKGMKHLSSWTFHSNKKLRCLTIDKKNTFFYVEKGIVYTKDSKRAVTSPFDMKHLNIKEGVEVIDGIAFWGNSNLKSISFPSSLKSIGDNSFAYCKNIKEIILHEGFEKCTSQCFWGDKNLELVDLPSTISQIDDETFYECEELRTIIIRKNEVLISFKYSNNPIGTNLPETCTLRVPRHLVEEYKKHPLWKKAKRIESI